MKKVVFLFPSLAGHVNRTIQMSNILQELGYKIYYSGTPDLLEFTQKNNFNYYMLKTIPFAMGFEGYLHQSQKYLESLMDRFFDKIYESRKDDIERMMTDLQPDIIFLDSFNYSDFILLYPQLATNQRVIQLQTNFPMYFSDKVPPLNTFEFPSKKAKKLWKIYFYKKNWRELFYKIKFLGKSDLKILRTKFKEQQIPLENEINTLKAFFPTFKNVEEWFLIPREIDFKEQQLFSWQRYIAPMIDLNRKEIIPKFYQEFVNNKGNSKLIFCSLGTVSKVHLEKKQKTALTFFNNLLEIASEYPNWKFIITIESSVLKKIEKKSDNVLILDYAPQIDILKKTSVFLTHAGSGSVLEAISLGVPMLLFPLNNKWDQNGTAARIVYYKLGLKSNLDASKNEIMNNIHRLIEDSLYKKNCKKMSHSFEERYSIEKIKNNLLTELKVQ